MLSYVKNCFRNCRLARMSNGEYCLIRDQGLVKGGRGLKHHETLIVFSIRGLAAKSRQFLKANGVRARDFFVARYVARLGRGRVRSMSHGGRPRWSGWAREFPATLLRIHARPGISFIKKPAALRRAGFGNVSRSHLDQPPS
jgi:hypothetical protein